MTTISDPSAMTPDDPRWLSWFMQQRRFDRLSRKAQTGASLITDFASGIYEMGYPGQRRGSYELSDIVKVSRSTGGGRFNSSGVYEWVGNDVPRLDYDPVTLQPLGILIEESRTNLLLRSSEFDNGVWSKLGDAVITPNTDQAPSGTMSADRLQMTTSGVGELRAGSALLGANIAHTFSVYLRSSSAHQVRLAIWNSVSGIVNGPIITLTTGFQRYSLTHSPSNGGSVQYVFIIPVSASVDAEVWGAQLEAGAFPTSYIPSADTWTSRASTATYFDAAGVMQTAASGVARSNAYGFDSTGAVKPIGLLLEGAATNLLTRSNSFAESAWIKANGSKVIPNATTTHDGKMIASKLVSASATAIDMDVRQAVTLEAAATFSIELKKAESNFAMIVLLGRNPTAGESKTTIDLTTLAQNQNTGGKALVVSKLPDGWVRVSIPRGAVTGSTQVEVRVSLVESMSNAAMVGDGVKGIYIARAQLETGSVATSYVPSTDTFTSRASTATYLDAAGVLQTAAVDVARSNAYAYDSAGVLKPIGLLLEGAATNLLLNSYFSLGTVGATPTSWISRGLVTGYKTVDESAFGGHVMRVTANGGDLSSTDDVRTVLSGLTGGVPLRLRMRVKPISGQGVLFFAGSTTNLPASGGWQIFSVTITPSGTSHGLFFGGTGQFDIDWVQVEEGSYATSYIPTTTAQVTRAADVSTSVAGVRAADVSTSSQVTRAADVCNVNTLSPWYNATEGTLFVEASAIGVPPSAGTSASFTDGTTLNRIVVGQFFTSTRIGTVGVANVDQAIFSVPSVSLNQPHKFALAWAANNFAASVDGGSPLTDSNGSIPTVTALNIGSLNSLQRFSGHIRSIRYYPRKLSDADLQTLTTP